MDSIPARKLSYKIQKIDSSLVFCMKYLFVHRPEDIQQTMTVLWYEILNKFCSKPLKHGYRKHLQYVYWHEILICSKPGK